MDYISVRDATYTLLFRICVCILENRKYNHIFTGSAEAHHV